MEKYFLEYTNEEDFRKKERSLKKYNMLAYKKLVFDYYNSIKKGEFLGNLESAKGQSELKYCLDLPTDSLFEKVHGKIKLHYTVHKKEKIVFLEDITPGDILLEGHTHGLATYRGVVVSKDNVQKDMFKINLLKILDKDR